MAKIQRLDDTAIRLICIPAFGFIIPNLTGLIDHSLYPWWGIVLAYLHFIFISFAIWQGNRFLLFSLRARFDWLNQPIRKVILLILANVFYTAPVSVGLLVLWYVVAGTPIHWDAIQMAGLMCVICVVFITNVYETVFLIKEQEADLLEVEKAERARAQAELQALKGQIDPHFLFNSLNTLSFLIDRDPEKARRFNENLADVYRYILHFKSHDLILLGEELEFLKKYYALMNIRFGEGLRFELRNGHEDAYNALIVPVSLQVLLENAVKHNAFSEHHPLAIILEILDDEIVMTNALRPKRAASESAQTGLKNLDERCRLIVGKGIGIEKNGEEFSVRIPLLRTSV